MRKDKAKKIVGIYAWLIDGEVKYIGHGHDIKGSRQGNHMSKMRQGKHSKKMNALWKEINDESNWELVIIEECSVHDLLIREQYWIDYYGGTKNLYNTNNVNNTKKTFRTGHKAKKHKEQYSQMFSGIKNPNCQNEIETVIAIKYLLENTDMKGREIAKLFGQNDEYVSKIKLRLRWKDIEVPVGYEFKPEQKIETVSTAIETTSEGNIFHTDIIPQIEINQPVETFDNI